MDGRLRETAFRLLNPAEDIYPKLSRWLNFKLSALQLQSAERQKRVNGFVLLTVRGLLANIREEKRKAVFSHV